jgi:hypothetical protein
MLTVEEKTLPWLSTVWKWTAERWREGGREGEEEKGKRSMKEERKKSEEKRA